MKTKRSSRTSLLTTFTAMLAGAAFCGSACAAEDETSVLLSRLMESHHTLAEGITQAEKGNGVAISAKFEVEDGKLWLSVYTAKAGLDKDAEHNALLELKGDATMKPWKPETEVFEDKKHLTRAAMQLTLVQLGKLSLSEIIEATKGAQAGDVYSIIPANEERQAGLHREGRHGRGQNRRACSRCRDF